MAVDSSWDSLDGVCWIGSYDISWDSLDGVCWIGSYDIYWVIPGQNTAGMDVEYILSRSITGDCWDLKHNLHSISPALNKVTKLIEN